MGNCCEDTSKSQPLGHNNIFSDHRSSTLKQQSKRQSDNHHVNPIAQSYQGKDNDYTVDHRSEQSGHIELPDGSRYVGDLINELPEGNGVQSHENGDKFIGSFVGGMKEGEGKYQYANGTVYTGSFKKGQIDGEGRMQWPNGDWYKGEFKNNKLEGFGKYYSKQNESYYEGSYWNGKRHGKGRISRKDRQYRGEWENGVIKYEKMSII